ncbi:MAG: hypothetical protein QGG42_04450 [Phycisphaerae bacterium]|jgi:hypothetical protein|nr:hypothetical protein [Phycisphaerae bacterium]
MGKLNIWRWAQYTLPGLLATSLIISTLSPDRGQGLVAKITAEGVLPVSLVIIAFGGYILGMMLWVVAVALRKAVTWPAYYVFQYRTGETRSYREYRIHRALPEQAEKLEETQKQEVLDAIPDHMQFLLELYRASESHPQYFGSKIVSSWQSCTLMLSVAGCLMLGAVLSVGRVVVMLFVSWQNALTVDLCVFVGLTVLYLLAGLASIQRNRLLVRDVVISCLLRKEKNGS